MAICQMPIYFPSDLLEALGEHTGHFWSDLAMESIIFDAVRAWMKPAPAAPQQPAVQSEAGYQWKQLFLPEGTRLRACFGRQPYFATVQGAEIKYGEHAISPSCFANLHGSGNRNAWKAVWLRFPGSDEWLRADVCRSARNAAIARLFGGNLHEAGQASEREKPAKDTPAPRAAETAGAPARGKKHAVRGRHKRRAAAHASSSS